MPPIYTKSQTTTYDAEGSLDRDISEIITNITPDKTPMLNQLPNGKEATELKFEWQLDQLRPPTKNQRPELDTYTYKHVAGVGRDSNCIQFFREDGMVSDAMQKVDKLYSQQDELARQKVNKMKEMARDMEYALVVNKNANLENGATLAMTGGIPYFLQERDIVVTFDNTTDKVTAAEPHSLTTGEFVVFRPASSSDTLPAGIKANVRYYIRQDASAPTTVFTLYKSLEDAVEDVKQVAFADDGVGTLHMMLNNVVDAEDRAYTENDLNDAMELAYHRGGNPTLAVMSPANKRRFTQILSGIHTTNRNQTDVKVENVISTYETDFGTLQAMAHREYGDDHIHLLDMNYWALRYFVRPHEVSGLPKLGSYVQFVLEGSFGLQGTQPLASACIKNIAR